MNLTPGKQTIPQVHQPSIEALTRKKYNMVTRNYYESGQAMRDPGTFAFMVTNVGTSIVTVNGMTLNPGTPGTSLGDSRTVATAFEGYEFSDNINIAFAAGGNNNLELVILFYNDSK